MARTLVEVKIDEMIFELKATKDVYRLGMVDEKKIISERLPKVEALIVKFKKEFSKIKK